jgi:hypothetical protein
MTTGIELLRRLDQQGWTSADDDLVRDVRAFLAEEERMRLTPAEYKALTYACQHGTFRAEYRKTLGALRDRLKSKDGTGS